MLFVSEALGQLSLLLLWHVFACAEHTGASSAWLLSLRSGVQGNEPYGAAFPLLCLAGRLDKQQHGALRAVISMQTASSLS
jgi:hypothetical protein